MLLAKLTMATWGAIKFTGLVALCALMIGGAFGSHGLFFTAQALTALKLVFVSTFIVLMFVLG